MRFHEKQIAPPADWTTFESLCHALFKLVWDDPTAQKNGRLGQAQCGVDVFGLPTNRVRYWGVQCKGKNSNYGSEAEWSEVLKEVVKADKFSPPLERWIFATTVPVDANLQKAARELTEERLATGLFRVDVLGWEEIHSLISKYPAVIQEFYPEHVDKVSEVIESLTILESVTEKLEANSAKPELLNIQNALHQIMKSIDGSEPVAAACQQLAEQLGVTKHLIERLLNRVRSDKVPEEKWADALDTLVIDYNKLLENARSITGDDTRLNELDLKSQSFIADGNFTEAEKALLEAVSLDDEKVQMAAEDLEEIKANASKRREMLGQSAKINGDYVNSAEWFRSAAEMLPTSDVDKRHELLCYALASNRLVVGSNGDANAYDAGVKIGSDLLSEIRRDDNPMLWADARVELASIHLCMHTYHRDDPSRVEIASQILEGSENFYDYSANKKEWIAAQNTHGVVWLELASESPAPADYEVAARHFEHLLRKVSPDEDFHGFVDAQLNLGVALLEFGRRQPSWQALQGAIRCSDIVLPMVNDFPNHSYKALSNKAFAQSTLADGIKAATEQDKSVQKTLLEDSIRNSEKSIELANNLPVFDDVELANLRNFLAIAKYRLGGSTKSEKEVRDAIAITVEIESVWTRERLPDRWAALQNNLGSMYRTLAYICGERMYYAEASKYYKACLQVGRNENHGTDFIQLVQDYSTTVIQNPVSNAADYLHAQNYIDQVLNIRGVSEAQTHRINEISEKLNEFILKSEA